MRVEQPPSRRTLLIDKTVLPLGRLCLLCAFVSFRLAAQTGSGVIQGVILDATGAAVPGAKVALKNTATGVVRNSQSSGIGIYHFASVAMGPYTLTVEAQGFKKWSGTITMEAGRTAVVDPTMEVGSLEATVEVTGATPIVTTQGAEVNDFKDALRIHRLPLNGRFVVNLFDLTPGVEGGGSPRTNGLKAGSTDMLLDGVSILDVYSGGIARVQPGLDSIQEYRFETSNSNAQYARPATVSMVTRGGANEFHGSTFETHRNNFGGLRARRREDSDTASKLIRNEFGISAGGSIIKNKTFWFGSYEGYRERQSNFARTQVPTPAIWGGDFRNAIDLDSNQIIIHDPLTTVADGTRTPFPDNMIPQDRITSFAETLHSVSPDPNMNLAENPWITPNFETYYPDVQDIDNLTVKGDHVFSERDNLSGRFTKSWRANRLFGGRYGYPKPGITNAGGTERRLSRVYTIANRWNHVFSPTRLNELQLSGHRAYNTLGSLADDTNWADRLGTPNPLDAKGWPTICADGPFFYYYGCWDAENRYDQQLTHYAIEDNLTWIKGKHTVKLGFKGRQSYDYANISQQAQGAHWFGADWTQLFDPSSRSSTPFTGSGLAGVLLGTPTSLSNNYNRGYFYFVEKELGLYLQDSWKLTPRLTLDLGLRWDHWTPYKEKHDRLINLDAHDYAGKMEVITPHNTRMEDMGVPPGALTAWKARGLTWVTADSAGFPGALVPARHKDFAPRVGLAWRVTEKWVLRAGFGIYYWPTPLAQLLASSRFNPPLNLRFMNDISSLNGAHFLYALTSAPSPEDFIGKARVDLGSGGVSGASARIVSFDTQYWAEDQAREWTFTIERELMKNTALRLSYIGNHGSNLEQRWRWNDPESAWNYQARTGLFAPDNPDLLRLNPNWNGESIQHNGFSNSQSLQANIERRYSNGLEFQWFYVFNHTMNTEFAVPENRLILGEPRLTPVQRLRLGYANSSEIPSHHFRWNGICDLPFGKGKKLGGRASRALDLAIGGWQVAFIGGWQSGHWSSVTSSEYLFGDPTLSADQRLEMNVFGSRQRLWFRGDFDPALATGVDQARLQQLVPADRSQRVLRPVGDGFDNRIPQKLADGTVRYTDITDMVNWNARNFYRGPGAWNEDLSIIKSFRMTERATVRLIADFFNFFNHPNDVNPDGTTGLQDLSLQANEPRIIQVSLRVEW